MKIAPQPIHITARALLIATMAIISGAGSAAGTSVPLPVEQPLLREIAGAPDPEQLQATVTALVKFGTRHTLSDTTSTTRGIAAAIRTDFS
jgi:hypothetical protein